MTDHLRDRRSVEERRDQLVDAAIEVLAAEGLTKATTRRITDHAGLALGAFHYAFRSKDDLLHAVIERIADQTEEALTHGLQGRNDLEGALRSMIDSFWSFVEEHPDLQLAQHELTVHALRDVKLRQMAIAQYDRFVDALSGALEEVGGPSDAGDREELARYLVATLDGLVLQSFVHEDPAAARRRLDLHQRCLPAALPSHV